MIKIVLVNYWNSAPFLEGLRLYYQDEQIILASPADCSRLFEEGIAQIGLVPTGALAFMKNPWQCCAPYCIGSDGAVRSVIIASKYPLEEIECIHCDAHSRSSTAMIRLIFHNYQKKMVECNYKELNSADLTGVGVDTCLIIGDKALKAASFFPYHYDVGLMWKEATGLPFTFALWVQNGTISPVELQVFQEALQAGLDRMDQCIKRLNIPENNWDVEMYFKKNIQYHLDAEKLKAIELFFSLLDSPVHLSNHIDYQAFSNAS